MNWKTWIPIVLVILTAGWMLFDGTRAIVVGDYVTPQSGEYTGQLGPWSYLVKAVGVEPRSILMKSVFVAYGVIALAMTLCFALNMSWGRTALMIVCILGLWYLPIGTLTNSIALILLLIGRNQTS
jgi:hypothetical protein